MKLVQLSIRTLYRFKIYTAINILGLALSLACVIIISRYVKQENDVDCYSPNKDRIGIMVQEYKDEVWLQKSANDIKIVLWNNHSPTELS